MADQNKEVRGGGETNMNCEDEAKNANEMKEPPPQDVVELCRETFKKTSEYLKGELEGTVEDYKLLETMNKITMSKYAEMKTSAGEIGIALQDLSDKYFQKDMEHAESNVSEMENLQPFLDQIDHIEDSVSSLEQAAYKLDAYSKRLEAKFKSLEKR